MTLPHSRLHVLLSFPFRLFFLLTGIYGAIIIPVWLGLFLAGWSLPVGPMPMQWHSHEVLYGLVPAAIAGFVLTAVCNWTGAAPLQGSKLLILGLVWLAGRVVIWNASYLPNLLVAVVDLLFLPALAAYLFVVLQRHGNKRNLILVAVIGLLFVGNLCMHMGYAEGSLLLLRTGKIIALDVIALIMVIIAGRIIPAFTTNWLRLNKPDSSGAKTSSPIEYLALTSTLLMLPADLFIKSPEIAGAITLTAFLSNAIRLAGWAGWKTLPEPLLWILHLGYSWLVLALLLKAMSAFGLPTASAWQHALGTGAMTTLILGVMTRVVLGHTGRPLKLPRFATLIYAAISFAAVFRLLTALSVVDYQPGLVIAGITWTLAFALFVLIYWPLLSQPRVDGRPG